MKQIILVVVMLIGFGVAHAEEVKSAEPVHAYLVSVDSSKTGADVKVSPSDYPNGVYVLIKEFSGERPISEAIFADKLRAQGFKIADNIENADATFRVGSTINFKNIDQNTSSVAARKIDGVTGAVISAVATGGLSILSTDYSFFSDKKPIYNNMIVEIASSKKSGGGLKITIMNASIKTDANNALATRVSFEILVDQWLKAHLANYDASQPMSAVAPTQSLADAVPAAKK